MTTLSITSPESMITAIPYLLGHEPKPGDVVLVAFSGKRMVFTARMDLADLLNHVITDDSLESVLVRANSDQQIMFVYADEVPGGLYTPEGVIDVVQVWDGRFKSALCVDVTCCPPAGKPLPVEPTVIVAELVLAGRAPARSRQAIEAEFALGAVMPAWSVLSTPLLDLDTRDAAWLEIDAHRADRAWLAKMADHYRLMACHCAPGEAAAPYFLSAWAYWRAGEGTCAVIANKRALDTDPTYGAARLLDHALTTGMSPDDIPAMRL